MQFKPETETQKISFELTSDLFRLGKEKSHSKFLF